MKLFVGKTDDSEDLMKIASIDREEFEVEKIVDHQCKGTRKTKSDLLFLIRWKGYSEEDDTWIPYNQCKELAALDSYARKHPELRL
jgi:hypothetical protein